MRTMQVYWQKLLVKTMFWLLAEVVLTLVGLDNLADYSEFLLSGKQFTSSNNLVTLCKQVPEGVMVSMDNKF